MKMSEIVQRQWDGYTKYHQSAANLWLHIVAVPVFIYGTLGCILALLTLQIPLLLISLLLMAAAIGVQGVGHKREVFPAEPFTGAKNALQRIFLEQLYTFPKFVISGGWYAALVK